MQTSSHILMPFAIEIATSKPIGIDEAKSGLGYKCLSCGMSVKARKKTITHHFAHHRKAETECDISYWVSIRSIAKQILEEATHFFAPSLHKNSSLCLSLPILNFMNKQSKELGCSFDLCVQTSIGLVYIVFLTNEDRNLYYKQNLPPYFSTALILEIDLSSMPQNHNRAKAYLKALLLGMDKTKQWKASSRHFSSAIPKPKHLPTDKKLPTYSRPPLFTPLEPIQTQKLHVPRGEEERKMKDLLQIPRSDIWFEKDFQTSQRMINFYEFMYEREVPYHTEKTKTVDFRVLYTGNNLWFVCANKIYYCVAKLATRYVLYTVINGNKIEVLDMANAMEDLRIATGEWF